MVLHRRILGNALEVFADDGHIAFRVFQVAWIIIENQVIRLLRQNAREMFIHRGVLSVF